MRSKEKLKEFAELALMFSIPNMTKKFPEKTRLGGLFTQLQKVTGKVIAASTFKLQEDERVWIEKQLWQFGEQTGWESTPKHIGTVLSFSIALAERNTQLSPRVLEKLNLIVDHLEAGGDLRVQSCWAGSLAMEKWDAIFADAPEPGGPIQEPGHTQEKQAPR
ncbi:MAG: hypothetical protein GY753_11840 [Gammaproteobacteria bacterium]|nr:hypothetical protein [Gammaproteobacteria bacterium]